MELVTTCKKCHGTFNVTLNVKKEEVEIGGQSITLTYYDCPYCSERYFGQADTSQSLRELQKYKEFLKRFIRMKRSGKDVPKKISERLSNLQRHLSLIRMELKKELTGAKVKMANGKEYELRFVKYEAENKN